nr:MAG: hypothetical protein [Caudoviricetes sp.]
MEAKIIINSDNTVTFNIEYGDSKTVSLKFKKKYFGFGQKYTMTCTEEFLVDAMLLINREGKKDD